MHISIEKFSKMDSDKANIVIANTWKVAKDLSIGLFIFNINLF